MNNSDSSVFPYIAQALQPLAVPLGDCHIDPANARRGHALDKIAASLARYGQRKPIVVNRAEGMKIEAGNGTWQAAKSLGWSHIAAVIVDDDPMTAVGFGIADNRLGDLSEWDAETLQALVDGLDPDLDLPTGFSDGELEAMLAELGAGLGDVGQEEGDAEPQTNRAEELRELWGVETGQMWRLPSRTPGQEHRLICGDCTDKAVVERVMGGKLSFLIVTDPPYGVGYEGGAGNENKREKLAGDGDAKLYNSFLEVAPIADKCALYMWHAVLRTNEVYQAAINNGFQIRSQIIWHKLKAHYGAFMAQYMQKHEPCIYCVKNSPEFTGASNEVTVWEYDQPSRNEYHPTEKPTAIIQRAIGNHPYNLLYEPFSGSGTAIIAAENLARQCRAVEISPAYVAVALQRYLDAFNITPELIP